MKEIYNWFRKLQEYESLRQQEAEMTSRRNWERICRWIDGEREKAQKRMDEFNRKIRCKLCDELKHNVFIRENEICHFCYHNSPKKSWHK